MRIRKKSVQRIIFEFKRTKAEILRNGFRPIKKLLNNKAVMKICKITDTNIDVE